MNPLRVCFVCLGNICRSPMADVITRSLLDDAGIADAVVVTSAGTAGWHEGNGADPPAVQALADAGYDGTAHRAQQFVPAWFDDLDLVVALDRSHQKQLHAWASTAEQRERVVLLRSFDADAGHDLEVADPYGHDAATFAACRDQVEAACRGLVTHLQQRLTDRAGGTSRAE